MKEEVNKNKDLTETNKILSDRIKLFEEKRVKDANDSIQPSDIPTNKTNPINEKMPSSQLRGELLQFISTFPTSWKRYICSFSN